MNKSSKNQVFVYRNIRKIHKDKHRNFNMLKYCIYDTIRKKAKEDTGVFEYKQKVIIEILNTSKGSVSNGIKYLISIGLLIKNDLGLIPNEEYWNRFIHTVQTKGSFVILDFNVKKKIAENGYFLTLEQFAILSMILSLQLNRYRAISKSSISRLLLIDKKTVTKGIDKLKRIGFINDKQRIKERIIEEYFFELKNQILYNQKPEPKKKRVTNYKDDKL